MVEKAEELREAAAETVLGLEEEIQSVPHKDFKNKTQFRLTAGKTIKARDFSLENLEWLGRGGNGTVFRMMIVSGPLRGLMVAVKFLETLEDQDRVTRFGQEIDLLESVQHPHIIEVLGRGQFKGQNREFPFFVMEYQPRNLERELNGHPHGIHPDLVLPLFLQTASALACLHSKDIAHRDLKPSNILFDGSNIKLADFGIAAIGDRTGITNDGQRVAPRYYMSPEQWAWWKRESNERPGKASDIFQLGLVMHRLLTGFNPNTVHQWTPSDKTPPNTRLHDMDGSLINDLVGLIREMLMIDSASRPTAAKLQDRLLVVFRAYSSHFSALYGVHPGREF